MYTVRLSICEFSFRSGNPVDSALNLSLCGRLKEILRPKRVLACFYLVVDPSAHPLATLYAAHDQEGSILTSRVRSMDALPWTSGKIASNQSSFDLPQPAVSTLTAGKTYVFRVRVWTAASASEWSESVAFDTAPSASAWSAASWIGGGEHQPETTSEFQRKSPLLLSDSKKSTSRFPWNTPSLTR